MAFDTKKLTLYAIQMDDYSKSWGGISYNTFLMDGFPELCADYNITETTDADSLRFLYLTAPDNVYVVDGVVDGAIVFYNAHAADSTTLTSITTSLRKTADVPSSETTLGSQANTVSDTILKEAYATYPFYFTVDASDDDKHVKEGELLLLYIEISHSGGDLEFSHANDSLNKDLIINIPIL
jgi:hypothetical protein